VLQKALLVLVIINVAQIFVQFFPEIPVVYADVPQTVVIA
jgi:hypothetical protein